MRIEKIRLQNFKRFSDLRLEEIPSSAKLVVLIGANGSGKTSIFDAFNWINLLEYRPDDQSYFAKISHQEIRVDIQFSDGKGIGRSSNQDKSRIEDTEGKFIGRSSLRIVPRIKNIEDFGKTISANRDAPTSYIDFDNRFDADVHQYTNNINKALRESVRPCSYSRFR